MANHAGAFRRNRRECLFVWGDIVHPHRFLRANFAVEIAYSIGSYRGIFPQSGIANLIVLHAIRYQVRPDELDYARVVVAISERSSGSRPAILRSRMRSASKRSLISGSFAIWTRRVAIESSCARNFALVKGIRGGTGMGELKVRWEHG